MNLTLLELRFAICRLSSDDALPHWAWHGPLSAFVRTDRELSIVTTESIVPDTVQRTDDWRALEPVAQYLPSCDPPCRQMFSPESGGRLLSTPSLAPQTMRQ